MSSLVQDTNDAGTKICAPAGEETAWSVEGEATSVKVVCTTGLSTAGVVFEINDLPEGAEFDPSTQILRWTPGLDQAGVYNLDVSAPEYNEQGQLTLGVADAFDTEGNIPPSDPTTYTMEYGLPVVWIDVAPFTDEWAGRNFYYRGKKLDAEGKIRGKSSRTYPKQSYAFRFEGDRLSETEVADFPSRKRIVLTSTFDDNSYVRQRFSFELWNRLDPTVHIETFSAVVYIDGQFHGLYTLTDHPNEELMQRSGLSDQGNLFKAETHDANFALETNGGDPKSTMHQGYTKTEGKPDETEPGAFDDLDEFIRFVASSSTDDFNREVTERIHVDDYHKWYLLVTFVLAEDSAGKNSYHYHNQTTTWRAMPWDFNASFGQSWTTSRRPADALNFFENRNRLFNRLGEHPVEGMRRRDLYTKTLSDGAFEPSTLLRHFDELVGETDAVARRDWRKWQDEYLSFERWRARGDLTTYDEEVTYIREWISQRAQIFSQLFPSPQGQ